MTSPQSRTTAGSERAIREALAAGPTPGEWTTAKSYGSGARCSVKAGLARIAVPSVTNINWEANAALIAACNPEAIASLLAELDRLRASQPSGAAGTPAATWRVNGEPDPHAGHYDGERAALCMGNLTDDELANGAFLNYDRPLDVRGVIAGTSHSPIVWMTAVKDRIRWLSRALERSLASPSSGGWQWVPVEPTREMSQAAAAADPERESVWAAYLSAAPKSSGDSHE